MLKTIPAIAAVGISAMLLVPTVSDAAETHSVSVSYADLNLVSPVGQRTLQHRIVFAAGTVCNTDDVIDLDMAAAVRSCRVKAIADAQPAFHAAVARAYHPSVTVLEASAVVVTAP